MNGQKSRVCFEEKGSKVTEVLITGGSGFLGINLTKKLIEKGQDVRIYDVRYPPKEIHDEVQYIEGDVRDQGKLEKALKGVDIIYHTAAMVPAAGTRKTFWEVNVGGTENAGRAAINQGVRRLVHVSSSSVYDPRASVPLTEKSPMRTGGGIYERSKCEGDLMIQKLIEEGLPATVIRPRTIVGPYRGGSFHMLFDWIMRGKKVYIIGKGDNKFQMTSASDLGNACILAAESDKAVGEIFNVGTDWYGTLKESIGKVIEHAGTGSRIVPLPVGLARVTLRILYYIGLSPVVPWHYNNMHRNYYFDTTKIKRVLGWKPTDSNEDMLIQSYDWFVEHFNEFDPGDAHAEAPDQKILKWLRKIS